MKLLTDNMYSMKQTLRLFCLVLVTLASSVALQVRADVTINETSFPDAAFRNWLLKQSYGSDGVITTSELESVKELDLHGLGISNPQGITYFRQLEKLYLNDNNISGYLWLYVFTKLEILNVGGNALTTLDLSNKLSQLSSLYVYGNQLTSINVTSFSNLQYFDCSGNKLSKLNVSNNANLSWLDCSDNAITELDLSSCTTINKIYCQKNRIASAQMASLVNSLRSGATSLCEFRVIYPTDEGNEMTVAQVEAAKAKGWTPLAYNQSTRKWEPYAGKTEKIIAIDATNFPDAAFRTYLTGRFGSDGISEGEIAGATDIDVASKNIADLTGIAFFTELENLNCNFNNLTALDLSANVRLKSLQCASNKIEALILPENSPLITLLCQVNSLTTLDVSKQPELVTLNCSSNRLSSFLNVQNNSKLETLVCGNNELSSLFVARNNLLKKLDCSEMFSLEKIEFSWLGVVGTSLQELKAGHTSITELDLQNLNKLIKVDIDGTSSAKGLVSTIIMGDNTALEELHCKYNKITALDLSGCPNLKVLDCSVNNIAGLDLSGCSNLTSLKCYSNKSISALDISACTAIRELDCSYCALSELDLSENSALTQINCEHNGENFTSLVMPTDPSKLQTVTIRCNNLSRAVTMAVMEALPMMDVVNYGVINVMRVDNNMQPTTMDFEKNQVSKEAVNIALAKNWHVRAMLPNGGWVDFAGLDEQYIPIDEEHFPDEAFRNFLLAQEYGSDAKLSDTERASVTSINLYNQKIADLSGIGYFEMLESLNIGQNSVSVIDLSTLKRLQTIEGESLPLLEELIVKNCPHLRKIDITLSPLTSLDLSGLAELESVKVAGNFRYDYIGKLSSITLDGNDKLETLDVSINNLTEIELAECPALKKLICNHNKLSRLDLSVNKALENVICNHNGEGFTSLVLPANAASLKNVTIEVNNLNRDMTQSIIDALPQRDTSDKGFLKVMRVDNDLSPLNNPIIDVELNRVSVEAVNLALSKNWEVKAMLPNGQWTDYPGDDGDERDICDVNSDGNVDVGDVNAVLSSILEGSNDDAYDVNNDNNVDVGDVNSILTAILDK